MKKISGAEYPLAKIFSSEFDYVIPSYQRPYAWTVDEASELFDDLYDFYRTEHDDTYFLGSIVLIKQETTPPAEVIDGQQRLTTLTILLATLTSRLEGELRADFFSYIREPGKVSQGLAPKPRLTLRERDKEFFAKYVQELNFSGLLALDSASLETESQRNIRSNAALMLERLAKRFADDVEALCRFGAFLVQRCFLVAVSTPSQQSAFRVFSVMNSRGLDLLPTDIIKADIIGKIEEPERQSLYNDRWEEMEVDTGRGGFNDLFAYVRMIFAKEKAKRALLEEFRMHVLSAVESPVALIEEVLEPYAEAYLIAKNVDYVATANAQEVNTYLRWLNRIDNSDWIPAAIRFLSQHKDDHEYVCYFFKQLERLAAFMHITGRNVNQRIERYALLLSEMDQPHGADSPLTSAQLTASEIKEMRVALDGNIYLLTARRRNYLILRLDSFLSDGAASYEPSLLTIEHVLPQTVSEGSAWLLGWPEEELRSSWVHRIANLVPLNQRRNSQALNYDFDTKKKAYFGGRKQVSSYVLTTQVLHTNEWTPTTLQNRQEALLECLYQHWGLVEA